MIEIITISNHHSSKNAKTTKVFAQSQRQQPLFTIKKNKNANFTVAKHGDHHLN